MLILFTRVPQKQGEISVECAVVRGASRAETPEVTEPAIRLSRSTDIVVVAVLVLVIWDAASCCCSYEREVPFLALKEKLRTAACSDAHMSATHRETAGAACGSTELVRLTSTRRSGGGPDLLLLIKDEQQQRRTQKRPYLQQRVLSLNRIRGTF
jgi:hypothetical protein